MCKRDINSTVYALGLTSLLHSTSIQIILYRFALTHWGWVTHICVSNLTTISSVNGLSPGWRQAITRTNPRILLIGPWETNFSEILIGIPTFSFKKMRLKVSSATWRPFCLGLNVLTYIKHANTTRINQWHHRLKCCTIPSKLYTEIYKLWLPCVDNTH